LSKQVTYDGRGRFEVRFSFDRRLVDLVKGLPSRRWHPNDKFWSVPEEHVVPLVDLLLPEGFGFDEVTCEIYRMHGGCRDLQPAAPPAGPPGQPSLFGAPNPEGGADPAPTLGSADDYTVARLNEQVKAVLASAFPAPIWLVGEISGFNKSAHKRHVSFHLAERDETGKTISEVSATLFEGTRKEITAKLAAAGDPFRLEDEVTVRMRVRVELYVPWGSYRVLVDDLDINYTLGEAARRREEIIRRLAEEGLLELNTALPFPSLPLKVGLITSIGSDAYNDVLRTLQESGFAFRVTAHGARVQGHLTEPSVLNALDWFRERVDSYDVVLVCRGGGSRLDLAWFDSEALGRGVATFPLPVVVGIGHEQDLSVLDAVGRRCKTPTAAAGYLVERVRDSLERAEETGRAILELAARHLREERLAGLERARRLASSARHLLEHSARELAHRRQRATRGARALLQEAGRELRRRALAVPRTALVRVGQQRVVLEGSARQVVQGARRDLAAARSRAAQLAAAIEPGSRRRLTLERERTEARSRRLHLVDPRRVVERGYSILRQVDGTVLLDADAAPAGTAVRAELKRGRLRLRSEGQERD
jgi:exodeoxyribonuclease VII large subunit